MTSYDPKTVDELLDALKAFGTIWAGGLQPEKTERLARAMNALRPPKRYYVLPEWSEVEGKVSRAGIGEWSYKKIRDITATDKPLCVIPAGAEWSDDDLSAIDDAFQKADPIPGSGTFPRFRAVIDAIKKKVEGGK